MEFNDEEKKQLLKLARKAIQDYLESGKKTYPENRITEFAEKRGVFVTLHKKGVLKGCIGYPLPHKPLYQAVVDNAISAATEDPRFISVTLGELKDIDIEISVLTLPREVKRVEEIMVGKHGIIVSKGVMRGLLLPQVPVEQGWNIDDYISHGCLKAGLPRDEWKRGVQIEVFEAFVFGEKEFVQSP